MRRLLTVSLTILLVLLLALPVLAGDGKGLKVGDKVVLDSGVVTEYLGRNADGTYRWKATIGAPLYLDDLFTPIECKWLYDEVKKEWRSGPNLFDAIVKDTKVTITHQDKKLSWQPDVFIGTKKQSPTFASGLPHFVDPINENYSANTLFWNYNSIQRNLRIIEGMLIDYYLIDSMPSDDILIVPHTTKDLGFVWTRPSTAWDANYNPLALEVGDNGELTLTLDAMRGATFPITIDPDTSFTTSSSDGYIWGTSDFWGDCVDAWDDIHDDSSPSYVSSSTTWAKVFAGVRDYDPDYAARIARSFVFFNTAGLPDNCEIDGATLRLYVYDKFKELTTTPDFIIQGGMPTYPHDPLISSDYYYVRYSGDYGQLTYADITLDQYNDWTLTATGKAAINKTGLTKFVIREEDVDEDDTWEYPSEIGVWEYNSIYFYAYEQGDGYRPTLEVTYSASAVPTITTDAASDVANTTAILNSTLTDDGGAECEVRWGYGTTTQTEANFLLYDTVTAWEGAYNSGEHPYYDATSLTNNTPYFFRVQARNDEGTTTGGEQTFTTTNVIEDPTNLRGYPQAASISLSWTRPSGATQCLVRFRYDTYPTTETDGTEVYLGKSASYTHNGLTPGTTYYYSVWGESGGNYSTSYDSVMVTTSAITEVGEDLPPPLEPTGWMQSPDPTAMENFEPAYSIFNDLADSFEVPRGTAWLGLSLLLCVSVSIIVYIISHNLIAGALTLVVLMAIGTTQELIPFWMVAIAILFSVGTIMLTRRGAA